ncbi:MAG: hypothetical protein C5B55_09100 [Blastocatellia bacterium]|nr:MAG: hypothetical protein C5B55_09100 [Blastocatellia bacterium]
MQTLNANSKASYSLAAAFILIGFIAVHVQAQSGVGPTLSAVSSTAKLDMNTSERPASSREIEVMKADLARQQRQILELQKTVDGQAKLIDQLLHSSAASRATDNSTVVSTQPTEVAAGPSAPLSEPSAGEPMRKVQDTSEDKEGPLAFKLGRIYLSPAGFFDFTAFVRDKNVGSGLGTNFGGIPFSTTPAGNLSEVRLSAQNSRIALRLDTRFRGNDVIGYLETDFNGFAPTNVAVTTNSNGPRMRLFWLDVRRGKWEFLGGQSWSLLTPNRSGLSPLPSNVFSTLNLDPNLQVGMVWNRDPQFRVVYHANRTVTLGVSLEAAEQYGGGSAGAGEITLPSALVSSYGPQLDTGDSTFSAPNVHPDIIGKISFDPKVGSRQLHFELAGLLSTVKFFNPQDQRTHTATGGGASVGINYEMFKNFRLIANGFYSDGGGRWIFGLSPDLIVKANGEPSLVHSASTVSGFEYQATPKDFLDVYYGGAYVQKNTAIDLNGHLVGYGYDGSPSNHNRSIQEITAGYARTLWRDPNYGALQFITQYSYVGRHPWSVAAGDPSGAHLNMLYLDLRYLFPGAPPVFK